MPELRFQCPQGHQNSKMVTDTGCIRRLAMMAKNPEKYQFSKCLGCSGPVPLESPQEANVEFAPAPVPQVRPKPEALAARRAALETAPSPAPQMAAPQPALPQERPTAVGVGDGQAQAEIAPPGANGEAEPGRIPLAQRPCSKCGVNPRLPYSRLCRDCNREYQNAHARKRRAEIREACQAQRLVASAEALVKEPPVRPDVPLPLVKQLQGDLELARACLFADKPSTRFLLASMGSLTASLKALAAAGGIPGWEEAS